MKTKFYWHIHHDVLVEPAIEPIGDRKEFIRCNKPKDEVVLRLKLLKPVKGKLPKEVCKTWKARYGAWEAYNKAGEVYYKTIKKHKKEIEELHERECPDCPWNGKSI